MRNRQVKWTYERVRFSGDTPIPRIVHLNCISRSTWTGMDMIGNRTFVGGSFLNFWVDFFISVYFLRLSCTQWNKYLQGLRYAKRVRSGIDVMFLLLLLLLVFYCMPIIFAWSPRPSEEFIRSGVSRETKHGSDLGLTLTNLVNAAESQLGSNKPRAISSTSFPLREPILML